VGTICAVLKHAEACMTDSGYIFLSLVFLLSASLYKLHDLAIQLHHVSDLDRTTQQVLCSAKACMTYCEVCNLYAPCITPYLWVVPRTPWVVPEPRN